MTDQDLPVRRHMLVQRQYLVPIYQNIVVVIEAPASASAEELRQRAAKEIDEADFPWGWEDHTTKADIESARETMVVAIAEIDALTAAGLGKTPSLAESAAIFDKPERKHDGLIELCPECGSGSIDFCTISVRPHCTECGYWPPVNFGTKADGIAVWNEAVRLAHGDDL